MNRNKNTYRKPSRRAPLRIISEIGRFNCFWKYNSLYDEAQVWGVGCGVHTGTGDLNTALRSAFAKLKKFHAASAKLREA